MGIVSEGVDVLKLVNKVQNADLYRELDGWIDKVRDLQKENEIFREERDSLREQVRFKGVIERVNGHVFIQGEDEEVCPKCAEVDLKPIHLIPHHSKHAPFQKAWCPKCEIEFQHNVPYSRALANGEKRPGNSVL
ncbi:MAG: hypothetical protein WAM66_01735 [Acidobacteriaceae bacterium]